VQLDFAQHLELVRRWPSRWWSRTRSRDRCGHGCRISAPERAIAWIVVVEPAESASVAWRCVVAGLHSVTDIVKSPRLVLRAKATLVVS
jgi:hypothetical protein